MLYISNKGLIEPGALALMGASVKEAEAIGKFGSGFKYAIATLLRNGYKLRVWSGKTEILLSTRPETFRDKSFEVLYVDGERTSITTSTGIEWKVRDAIREIWSNAIDEGSARVDTSGPNLRDDRTVIGIEFRDEVREMYENWSSYFVHDLSPLEINMWGRIISQPITNYYRRGVWICEDREKPGIFSYDFQDIELPESRKIKTHSASYEVYRVLSLCSNSDVWDTIFQNRNQNAMEWFCLGYWGIGHSSGKAAAQTAFEKHWDFFGNERNRSRLGFATVGKRILWVNDSICASLSKCGFSRIEDSVDFNEAYTITSWPIGYLERVTPLVKRLARVGIDYSKFKIVYAQYLDPLDSPIAQADMKGGLCVLSERAFEITPDMLLKALIEEWTHLEHKVLDNTVAQQHVYLDLITSLMDKIERK